MRKIQKMGLGTPSARFAEVNLEKDTFVLKNPMKFGLITLSEEKGVE